MKLSKFIACATVCAFSLQASAVEPVIPRDDAMEKRIDQLLKTLTLEEKIGQMTELTLGVLDGPYDPAQLGMPYTSCHLPLSRFSPRAHTLNCGVIR